MEFWEGKVAIVTGASGAIGGAVAKELVRRGMIVCALARRKDKVDVRLKYLIILEHKLIWFDSRP